VSTKLPLLTDLTIKDCFFDLDVIRAIAEGSKNLERLTIHGYELDQLNLPLSAMKQDYFPNLKWIKRFPMSPGLEAMDVEELEKAGIIEEFEERFDIYDVIDIDE
jgi:hypothetical protein